MECPAIRLLTVHRAVKEISLRASSDPMQISTTRRPRGFVGLLLRFEMMPLNLLLNFWSGDWHSFPMQIFCLIFGAEDKIQSRAKERAQNFVNSPRSGQRESGCRIHAT